MMKKGIVMTFGRFQPPTKGHLKLVEKMRDIASNKDYDVRVYLSHRNDSKTNPLEYENKFKLAEKVFGGDVIKRSSARTLLEALKEVEKYKNVIMVFGGDRVEEFKELVEKYNGVEYLIENLSFISAGDRFSDDVSSTNARASVLKGDYNSFKKYMPDTLTEQDNAEIFKDLQKKIQANKNSELDLSKMIDDNPWLFFGAVALIFLAKGIFKPIRAYLRRRRELKHQNYEPVIDTDIETAKEIVQPMIVHNHYYYTSSNVAGVTPNNYEDELDRYIPPANKYKPTLREYFDVDTLNSLRNRIYSYPNISFRDKVAIDTAIIQMKGYRFNDASEKLRQLQFTNPSLYLLISNEMSNLNSINREQRIEDVIDRKINQLRRDLLRR